MGERVKRRYGHVQLGIVVLIGGFVHTFACLLSRWREFMSIRKNKLNVTKCPIMFEILRDIF